MNIKYLNYPIIFALLIMISCSNDKDEIIKKQDEAKIEIKEKEISFETTYLNNENKKSIIIENKGKADLKINKFLIDNSVFTAPKITEVIKAGKRLEVRINFLPTEAKKYESTLKISSNGGDLSILLKGEGKVEEIVNIPGAFFKDALLRSSKINTNGDNEIQVSEAISVIDGIDFSNQKIENIQGIEAFVNITGLNISNNKITGKIDLSKNTKIKLLYCNHNNLENIVVTGLDKLTEFNCSNNEIDGELSLDTNISLTNINCGVNSKLKKLNIDKNIMLKEIIANDTAIDVLNTSKNIELENINLTLSKITALDFSNNKNLTTLNCESNFTLTSLNLANGSNTQIKTVSIQNNANLKCVKIDENFTPGRGWSYSKTGYFKTKLSSECN